MSKHKRETFSRQPVVLDGNEYTECVFNECEIMYAGADPPKLAACVFNDCHWKFYGGPARALLLLASMYSSGMRDTVDRTIDNIRGSNRAFGIAAYPFGSPDTSGRDIHHPEVEDDSPFRNARLKIKRAYKYIDDFNDAAQSFINSGICRLNVERDSQSGDYLLKVEWTKTPPEELPLILGDAIHNLRAALDYAWCDVITGVGEETDEHTRFRIFNDRRHLVTALETGKVKNAPGIIDAMADTVKAYRAGNGPLLALHNLDITDKHELIIPTFNVAALNGFTAFTVTPDGTPNNLIGDCSVQIGDGGALIFARGPEDFHIQNPGSPAFNVVFRSGQPFEGKPIVPMLHQFAQLVTDVLDALEPPLLAFQQGRRPPGGGR